MTRRLEKVNELIRREVSEIVQRDLKDPNLGFTTISRVETTRDLSYAMIYVSVMGDESAKKRTIKHLNKAAGYIQHQLSASIRIRTMPRITFKLDSSVDYSMRINDLLKRIAEDDSNREQNSEEEHQQ